MNKIKNYEELIVERKRLEADLRVQKEYINAQFNNVKEKLEPVSNFLSFVTGSKNRPIRSLLKLGSSVGIELLVRQKLAKAGWLAKLILPLVLRFTAAKTIDAVGEKSLT